jgi:16S rRNA (guanine(966)-N(2))-methyltransferase RsmD
MRVIAGTLKGRRLSVPKWDGLRPTSDKLRETLFNVIAPRIDGVRFLDGYAGTGAIGIEALSRGAAHVTFVESDPRACRLIKENLDQCGLTDGYTIVRGELAVTATTRSAARMREIRVGDVPFDLVFLDPPYADPKIDLAVQTAIGWLSASGLLIVEHAARETRGEVPGARLTRNLKSGDSALAFYERADSV